MTVVPRYTIVFNPSDAPIVVDDDGKVCEPHGWAAGNLEYVGQLIVNDTMREIDPDTINDQSNPDVILIKEQVHDLNKEVKKEQRKEDRRAAKRDEEKAEN